MKTICRRKCSLLAVYMLSLPNVLDEKYPLKDLVITEVMLGWKEVGWWAWGGTVGWSLSYKTEGWQINSRWFQMNVFILNFSPHSGPVVYSDTNRNEYQYQPFSNKIISHIQHLYKVWVTNFQENPSHGTRNKAKKILWCGCQ
jgi:hypothetical protein